ncbi:peptidoglycan DD-metalloendopeptidase family protein [Candidatus Pelagibacter bacterium nBUS_25]|uniref:M23 family metallopeptidase n=1 Tax=Candidatus Pelagibacter bacterium nBUS_25 TaxID=3374187 RepID=UPI003EC0196D
MLKKLQSHFFKNLKISGLIFLVIFTITVAVLSNHQKSLSKNQYNNFINNIYFKKTLNEIINNLEPKYKKFNHKIKSGETFDKILNDYSIEKEEISAIKESLLKKFNINKLNTNQKIQIILDQTNNKIKEFIFQISNTEKIYLSKNSDELKFNEKILTVKLDKKIIYKENTILQSLYKAATDKNIPPNTIIEFARIYGFQVDFQRDIRKEDIFQIMYEVFVDENNKIVESGEILFANLKLSGQDNSLYYFDKENAEGHYDKNGKSVQKALMKTPINGARLSSSFGMRKHPIDGFNKMHRGTDFAAPKGTPIMASGNGIIKKAGWCGGGGNCVKIRHNSTYETIYAHMSKFARGIKKGIRVKQGQTIGYVGSTGKSTGPHLHYEVIVNGKKVNSQKLKLPSGKVLKGKNRKLFETIKIKLDVQKSEKIIGLN